MINDLKDKDAFCDNQPILQGGSIQAFGLMVVLDFSFKILQVSANAEKFFGCRCDQVVGKNLADFLSAEDYRFLQQEIKNGDMSNFCGFNLTVKTATGLKSLPASFCVFEKYWIVELEWADEKMDFVAILKIRNRISKLILNFKQYRTLQEMSDATAAELRSTLGMDKVMVYRFDENWHGTVLSESKESAMEAYLGLRFPATDIPAPARQLYAINPIRMIPNINDALVPLEPVLNPLTGEFSDMRTCILRGVASVHLEYLKNMQVCTSISVSIIKNSVLWGLIAFHHRSPKTMHVEIRSALRILEESFSARLMILESYESKEQIAGVADFRKTLTASALREDAPLTPIRDQIETVSRSLDAQGAAIYFDEQWFEWGVVPQRAQLQKLMEWLQKKKNQAVYSTDFLSQEYLEGETIKDVASGLLAISVAGQFEDFVLWFRPEVVQTVKWGGDPGQTLHFGSANKTYHPRKSFEIWKETVRGHAVSWKASEKSAAAEIRQMLADDLLRFRSAKLKTISGILPICASCKKIRDEKNSWEVLELYIEKRSKAEFSHGICPDCYKKALEDAGIKK